MQSQDPILLYLGLSETFTPLKLCQKCQGLFEIEKQSWPRTDTAHIIERTMQQHLVLKLPKFVSKTPKPTSNISDRWG